MDKAAVLVAMMAVDQCGETLARCRGLARLEPSEEATKAVKTAERAYNRARAKRNRVREAFLTESEEQ